MRQGSQLVAVALAILTVKATSPGKTQLCRFVCPDGVGGGPLMNENLLTDGAADDCEWFGDGFGLRAASFDSVRLHNNGPLRLYTLNEC